jgi:hypothetical protein
MDRIELCEPDSFEMNQRRDIVYMVLNTTNKQHVHRPNAKAHFFREMYTIMTLHFKKLPSSLRSLVNEMVKLR